jgi:hypothetical protein
MAASIETQTLNKEDVCLAICRKFNLDAPNMSGGGTVRSELLDRIGFAIGLNVAGLPTSYRKFEKLVAHFGGAYDMFLDSSEHSPDGGGTISAHGWRKLAHLSKSMDFYFILNHAEAEVSEKYSDDFGRTYGFSQNVTGRRGILESGVGSRVIFYNTANSKMKPQQAFVASARVSSIEFPGEGEYILRFDEFQKFHNPVMKKDVEIVGKTKWNSQQAIAEITQPSFQSIMNEGTKLTSTPKIGRAHV